MSNVDLVPSDADLLAFESRFYHRPGAKEQAIRDELSLGAIAYYRRLVGILADPDPALAVRYGPLLNRLRRRVDTRQRRAS